MTYLSQSMVYKAHNKAITGVLAMKHAIYRIRLWMFVLLLSHSTIEASENVCMTNTVTVALRVLGPGAQAPRLSISPKRSRMYHGE